MAAIKAGFVLFIGIAIGSKAGTPAGLFFAWLAFLLVC